MRKIFVTNGNPEGGKTTFGRLVGEYLNAKGYGFVHASSIDPVKEILKPESTWGVIFQEPHLKSELLRMKRELTPLDWDGDEANKTGYWRAKMSELKFKLIDYDSELINGLVLAKLKQVPEPMAAFVDIREPVNIESFIRFSTLHHESGIRTILITSDMEKSFNNLSDESIRNFDYDIHIANNRKQFGDNTDLSLLAFKETAKSFVDEHILNIGLPIERRV